MSDAPLLNELCSICNINKFKYRCPGCDARTCSLPCYKRHQQWAQCSGQRDPTKFVKKSQLVTPAGIDHDYNFLSGIERNLEKAETVAGVTTATAPSDGLSNRQRAGVPYGKLEAAASVKIIRAPQGLSRQKENKSHMSATKKASRNIVWTVEWIDENRRRVLTETSSVHQIKDAQPFAQHDTDGKSKRRKLNTNPPATTTDDSTHLQQQYVVPTPENQSQSLPIDYAESEQSTSRRGATPPRSEKESTTKRQADVADAHPIDTRHDEPSAKSLRDGYHRFFLLKPRTSTTRHVLIPLEPSHTLAESLRGHTILEFPTIHVFPVEMDKLPEEEFMLEEEYMKLEGEQQKEFDELMGELDPEVLKRLKEDENGVSRNAESGEEEVDSKKILDVLKQDLGGRL